MEVMVLTFVVLATVIIAMSVGVLMGRTPIKGSCGGMASLGLDTACDICGGDPKKCDEEQEAQQAQQASTAADSDLAYEVKAKG
ncbi:MAG: (Na+)-NQR maturation NqrM [Pontibacterium sp.]